MDGKKRIARLRNAEKWKKLGFPGPCKKQVPVDLAPVMAVATPPAKLAEFTTNTSNRRWSHNESRWKAEEPPKDIENFLEVKDRYGYSRWVPKGNLKTSYGYEAWLTKKGWQKLGRGTHSSVYGRANSDKVIKVTRSLDNWIDYIQWAAKNGYAGNLAPRVYSWKRRGDWSVAVVEKMYCGSSDTDGKFDGEVLMSLTYPARKGNVLAQLYMEDIQKGSVSFFEEISKQGFDGDIGGNNIMYRTDGSLCLTDPCAGRIRTTLKRLRSGDLSPSLNLLRRGLWKTERELSTV